MIIISVYGRLGADPNEHVTKAGKPMASGSLAVNVAGSRAEGEDTEWFKLLAFGKVAEQLLRHGKGDNVGVMGRLERERWTDRQGEERASWQVVVDALHSSRTVRPGGRQRKRGAADDVGAGEAGRPPPFDDEMPF